MTLTEHEARQLFRFAAKHRDDLARAIERGDTSRRHEHVAVTRCLAHVAPRLYPSALAAAPESA